VPDEIYGEAIIIFIVPETQFKNENLEEEVNQYLIDKIGKVAKPKNVFTLTDLPKTSTGKILRRILKSKLLHKPLGDLSALENPQVLDEISSLD